MKRETATCIPVISCTSVVHVSSCMCSYIEEIVIHTISFIE